MLCCLGSRPLCLVVPIGCCPKRAGGGEMRQVAAQKTPAVIFNFQQMLRLLLFAPADEILQFVEVV